MNPSKKSVDRDQHVDAIAIRRSYRTGKVQEITVTWVHFLIEAFIRLYAFDEGRFNLWTKKSTVAKVCGCMHVIAVAPGNHTLVVTVYHN